MCTGLGLGHNFRYKYYGVNWVVPKLEEMRTIGNKLWLNPNLLCSDVRHLGSHTSGAPKLQHSVSITDDFVWDFIFTLKVRNPTRRFQRSQPNNYAVVRRSGIGMQAYCKIRTLILV